MLNRIRTRWPFNRGETFQLVGWLVILLAAIPRWLDLLDRWGIDAARVAPYLHLVNQARWLIVAVAALGVLFILGRRFREPLASAARGRYASAMYRAASPVRDEVAAMLCDRVSTDRTGMGRQLTKALDAMPSGPFYTLCGILDAYDPTEKGRVVFKVDDIPYFAGWDSQKDAWNKVLSACDNLIGRQLLSQKRGWRDRGDYYVEIHLGPLVPPEMVDEVREWVDSESKSRW